MDSLSNTTIKVGKNKRHTTPFKPRGKTCHSNEGKRFSAQEAIGRKPASEPADEQLLCYDCQRELDEDMYQPTEVWIWSTESQSYHIEKVCPGGSCQRFAAVDMDGW